VFLLQIEFVSLSVIQATEGIECYKRRSFLVRMLACVLEVVILSFNYVNFRLKDTGTFSIGSKNLVLGPLMFSI